jgi:hypothetical protein
MSLFILWITKLLVGREALRQEQGNSNTVPSRGNPLFPALRRGVSLEYLEGMRGTYKKKVPLAQHSGRSKGIRTWSPLWGSLFHALAAG